MRIFGERWRLDIDFDVRELRVGINWGSRWLVVQPFPCVTIVFEWFGSIE